MQFFTADERFKGSTLGKFIPAISVVNIHNNVNLVVTMQFTDNDDDTKQFVFPNIGNISVTTRMKCFRL